MTIVLLSLICWLIKYMLTWQPKPRSLSLDEKAIHVWRFDLDDCSESIVASCQQWLSQDEQARAQRYATQALRQYFILTRGQMREVLANYLNTTPGAVTFSYTENGKPYLQNSNLQFNLSHSGDYALLAVTRQAYVGIDIEDCTRKVEYLELAQRFFHPDEYQQLSKLPDNDLQHAFFQVWTAKEALVKATGQGIANSLDKIFLNLDTLVSPQAVVLPDMQVQLWVELFMPMTGYQAAVAYCNPAPDILFFA